MSFQARKTLVHLCITNKDIFNEIWKICPFIDSLRNYHFEATKVYKEIVKLFPMNRAVLSEFSEEAQLNKISFYSHNNWRIIDYESDIGNSKRRENVCKGHLNLAQKSSYEDDEKKTPRGVLTHAITDSTLHCLCVE